MKPIKFIVLWIVLQSLIQVAIAQSNFIVCGQVDPERDVFYDIQPDTLVDPMLIGSGASEVYLIDLDGNQLFDFRITATVSSSSGGDCDYILIQSLHANNKIAYFIKHDSVPDIFSPENPMPWIPVDYTVANYFPKDDTVNYLDSFIFGAVSEDVVFLAYNTSSPFYEIIDDWLNIGEKYIGVSMQVNDVTLYGWILVEVTDYFSVIVKEFACNKNPYIGISPNSTAKAFELYPNPAKNEVVVALNGEYAGKPAAFALYNLSGKKLLQVDEIPQNGRIALPALAKGLYIVEIEADGHRFSQKLQIE